MSNNILHLEDFRKAINRLEEVLKLEKTEVVRDSAIKRFELCFDLAWKSIKAYAQKQGLECFSPRSCLKIAFKLNLIEYDEIWLTILEDRNLTTHMYKEEYANKIYIKLSEYLKLFMSLSSRIEKLSQE